MGQVISNPQGVADMVRAVRGEPGGRFFVTPLHRLVLVRSAGGDRSALFAAGALDEPFRIRPLAEAASAESLDAAQLRVGEPYGGPTDKTHGTYALRQRGGGRIERRVGARLREYALLAGVRETAPAENARRVLEAWRAVSSTGMDFYLNSLWHAWYLEAGEPRFLAEAPGGFEFPSDSEGGS
jgi:hypothetical protein